MAAIDISSTAAPLNDGVLQLQNGVAMDSTLRNVADQNDTTSPLKLSTTAVQVVSPLRITTDDPSDFYLDCEDGSTNNRFSITRNTASQQVNLNFSSNPGGGSAIVGAIRTYVDDVNLSEIVQFREDGRIQIGSTAASAMYWDNTNNRLGVGLNTPVAGPFQVKTTQSNANGSIIFTNNTTATILAATDTGSALTQLQFRASSYNFTDTAGMRIASTGYATTPTAMLQVVGSGSTSATTSLLVQNSGGTQSLRISDDGTINTSFTAAVYINFLLNVTYDITARGLFGNSFALNLGGQGQGNASATMVNIAAVGSPAGTIGTSLKISPFVLQGATHIGVTYNGDYTSSVGANTLIGYDFSPTNYGGSATLRAFQSSVGGAYLNTTSYNASAILQADSTTQGFLPPRMTNAQRAAITTPAVGLMVYCTDAVEGIYVYKSTGWTFVA